MKRLLLSATALLMLCSCSFRNEAQIDPAIRETELLAGVAKQSGKDSLSASLLANSQKAKSAKSDREYEQAYALSDASVLSARLAIAQMEKDSIAASLAATQKALSADEQDRAAYQNLLNDRRLGNSGSHP